MIIKSYNKRKMGETLKTHSLQQTLLKRTTEIELINRPTANLTRNSSIFTNESYNHINISSKSKSTSAFPMKNFKSDYDVWDLTYTLTSLNLYHHIFIVVIFAILLVIRYYLTVYVLYLWISNEEVGWKCLLVLFLSRVLFWIMVMKISLKTSETKTEIILKMHWNSKYNVVDEYFQVLDWKMLWSSFLRGMVPAELSFVYLQKSPAKKFKIYATINYIYSSIESVFFYPFIGGYLWYTMNHTSIQFGYESISAALLAEGLILGISILLLCYGIWLKYKSKQE